MRKRRGGHGGGHGSSERWLLTYADLITLLLAFFVILYALAQTDHKKVSELINSMRSAFHFTQGAGEKPLTGQPDVLVGGQSPMDFAMLQMQDQLEKEIAKQFGDQQAEDGQQAVTTTLTERGLVVSLASSAFFDAGAADLRPDAIALMRTVAWTLKNSGKNIMIEGHTDDTPIHTAMFPSNWELSTHRATAVVRYLVEAYKLPPERLSAAGYGEYKPLVANTSPANRAKNRRVDIVILKADIKGQRPAGQL